MNISYQDIAQVCASFQAGTGLSEGKLCKVTENGTVGSCTKGDAFHGVAMNVHNGMAAVTLRGFVTVKYTGTAPTVGECGFTAASAHEVELADGGRSCLVVNVDTTNQEVTILL